jgi:D-sedoheptulose 7-phosphate isomerase
MVDIASLIEEHQYTISTVGFLIPIIEKVGQEMVSCLRHGGKVLFMGNGGSAADAQHLAAELIGRFQHEREAYAALALTTDTSVLTAIGNDYGYQNIFSRQIQGLCKPEDVVVGISTSGNSPNIIAALHIAKSIGAVTVGLSGKDGGELRNIADYCLTIPHQVTARIQEAHIFIGHVLCDWVEQGLMKEDEDV